MSRYDDEDVEDERQNAENNDDDGHGAAVTVATAPFAENFFRCCVAHTAQLVQQERVVDTLHPRFVTVALFDVDQQL